MISSNNIQYFVHPHFSFFHSEIHLDSITHTSVPVSFVWRPFEPLLIECIEALLQISCATFFGAYRCLPQYPETHQRNLSSMVVSKEQLHQVLRGTGSLRGRSSCLFSILNMASREGETCAGNATSLGFRINKGAVNVASHFLLMSVDSGGLLCSHRRPACSPAERYFLLRYRRRHITVSQ